MDPPLSSSSNLPGKSPLFLREPGLSLRSPWPLVFFWVFRHQFQVGLCEGCQCGATPYIWYTGSMFYHNGTNTNVNSALVLTFYSIENDWVWHTARHNPLLKCCIQNLFIPYHRPFKLYLWYMWYLCFVRSTFEMHSGSEKASGIYF